MSSTGEPTDAEMSALARGEHADPHTILGVHASGRADGSAVVRALFPADANVDVVVTSAANVGMMRGDLRLRMQRNRHGILEASIPAGTRYHYEIDGGGGGAVDDPYRFPPSISERDIWLFKSGALEDTARLLGAHPTRVSDVDGFNFVVWAPCARGVSVVGDFNNWDATLTPMRQLGGAVFEVFLPGVKPGLKYMFSIATSTGGRALKCDPCARTAEMRPGYASVTAGVTHHVWRDDDWMRARATSDPLASAVSTYELHLPSWRKNDDGTMKSYRQLADELVPHLVKHGFNAIEIVGLAEHPLDDSWGYQVTGYYAPTSRHGGPDDFKYFVDAMHRANIRVMYDWVPAHFPKDQHALASFDGTHLFDHEDNRLGEHLDWGTRIFNYGRPEVKSFLLGGLVHMLDEYHLDGVRVDAVASMLYLDYSRRDWIPNEYGGNHNLEAIAFLREVNTRVAARFPGVLKIAEESTSFPGVTGDVDDGGLGFDLKWNMGWMHDTLAFFQMHADERAGSLDALTNTLLWAHSERFVAALSHDEVVHLKRSLLEKMPGDDWQKRANLRLLYAWMFAYPGHKLLFMGAELAQSHEWDFKGQLEWHRADDGVGRLLRDLNALYRDERALHQRQFAPDGVELVMRDTGYGSVAVAISRKALDGRERVLCVCNFTTEPKRVRVGVDEPGQYRELINTDARDYGGSGVGNAGAVVAGDVGAHGKRHSVELQLPPLGALMLKRA